MADAELLHKAINNAKQFENFNEVLLAVSLHPEWLTLIPEGRQWAILHQTILSGNVPHLNQVLNLQKSNRDFRLLTDTCDGKTVLSIAQLRKDVPAMKDRIEELIQLDQMLNHARECKWDQCYEIVRQNPTYANKKPPYRRYYLIHQMAFADAVEEFKRFKQINGCFFNSTLRIDQKKINVFAREQGSHEFAELMEQQYPNLLDKTTSALDELSKPSEEAIRHTKAVTLMVQNTVFKDLDEDLLGEAPKHKSRNELHQYLADIRSERVRIRHQTSAAVSKVEDDKHKELILDNLTCPLSLAIFVDPVIAADGSTYERSAITKWLEKNNLSPVTNETLADKVLNPNNVVKQIIAALQSQH